MPYTRYSTSTPCRSKSGTGRTSATRPSTSPLASTFQALRRCSGCGSPRPKGAKFWLQIVTELKNRGVQVIFIACVDGIKGFPEAIEAVFPDAQVQLCVVHLVRHSLNYVGWKQRKEVAADLQHVYRAATREEAELHLAAFAEKWDSQFPTISKSWRANWERIVAVLCLPGGHPQSHLHDQRHRVGQHESAEDH